MEERKNNKGLVVLVTVLVVTVLGLIGFVVYDKVIKDDNSNSSSDNNVVENNNTQNENSVESKKYIDIEQLKKSVSKVLSFNNLNDDFSYLKLTKSGDLSIGINLESSLYSKYSKEHVIANEVLDVYIFDIGNGGYQYIYALKKDGTIDRMEIPVPAKNSNFKWEENYKSLKNIIYLDLYSEDSPKSITIEGEPWDVYHQIITAVDTEGKVYNLGEETTKSIYIAQ